MRKQRSFVYILLIILMLFVLIRFTSPTLGSTLTSILTTMTTIVGLFSVFYEMRKSANIAECNFMLELMKYFRGSLRTQRIYEKLDAIFTGEAGSIDKSDRADIEDYLSFLEMLCDLIVRDAISIRNANQLFGYVFFLATNRKEAQDLELNKYHDYYRNIFKVYPQWAKYRKAVRDEIPFSDTPLYK